MSQMLHSDAAADHGRMRQQGPRAAEQIVPLLRLQVSHEYGATALVGLRLTPIQATQALCGQYGLLLRSQAQGLALYAPQQVLPLLWQAQREEGCDYLLAWRLDCNENLFALASAEYAPRHLLLRLALCSALDNDCETWCASLNHTQELRLAARQCEWKYLLLGDWASLAASGEVEDLHIAAVPSESSNSTSLQFHRDTAQETLPDGRLAWVYRSAGPLPLAEHYSYRVALSDTGSNPARVLMAALPHGAPRSLQRETRTVGTHWVTEIFLIR